MALSGITLQNVKAFSSTQSIPIRPITLIFGRNSSGKSTILQSLLLLAQSYSLRDSAEDSLIFRGPLVDLSGYSTFVHARDQSKPFSIGAMFDASLIARSKTWLGSNHIGCVYAFKASENSATVKTLTLTTGSPMNSIVSFERPRDNDERLVGYRNDPKYHYYDEADFQNSYPDHPGDLRVYFGNLLPDNASVLRQYFSDSILKLRDKALPKIHNALDKGHSDWIQPRGSLLHPELGPGLASSEELSNLKSLLQHLENLTYNTFCEALANLTKHFMATGNLVAGGYTPATLIAPDSSYLETLWRFYSQASDLHFDNHLGTVTDTLHGVLTSAIHIGPRREDLSRFFLSPALIPTSVGQHGQDAATLLHHDRALCSSVNGWLDRLNVPYEIVPLTMETPTKEQLVFLTLRDRTQNVTVQLPDVGYGIRQILPIVVQNLTAKGQLLLIEEPETHVHPALQSEMADLFIESAKQRENTLIIETHSEHLILRILRRIREAHRDGTQAICPDDVSVVYVENTRQGAKAYPIPLTSDGGFDRPWPSGFFPERAQELFD